MLYRGVYIDGNEPQRRTRLAEVVDDLHPSIRARIKSLYDHKGSLTVRWIDHLYESNRACIVEIAWSNRGETSIAHVSEHAHLCADSFPFNEFEDVRPARRPPVA